MEPLASKIRPQKLSEFVGQTHLVGKEKPLRTAMDKEHVFSFILWGPPGVGKTTLARIYAKTIKAQFYDLSAVSAGKSDIKEIVDKSGSVFGPSVLFLDEIHRFNKAQQDYLLPFVERGTITLVGATTENPSFEVISALLSRCSVFVLNELSEKEIGTIIRRATKSRNWKIKKDANDWLIAVACGDARQVLTLMDTAYKLYDNLSLVSLKEALQSTHLRYDKKGDEHYNTISAFIKSMRASDPDATLYYLARMVDSGEDPKFIARRMVVFASEDVGMAQPTALVLANEVFRACETIGYPECSINIAHGAVYLATAKKNRASYNGLCAAKSDVSTYGNLPIPMHIRNTSTKLMKNLGYGKGYEKYPKEKNMLPEKLKNRKYYLKDD